MTKTGGDQNALNSVIEHCFALIVSVLVFASCSTEGQYKELMQFPCAPGIVTNL